MIQVWSRIGEKKSTTLVSTLW